MCQNSEHFLTNLFSPGIQHLDLSFNKLRSTIQHGIGGNLNSDAGFVIQLGFRSGATSLVSFAFSHNLLVGFVNLVEAESCKMSFDGSNNKIFGAVFGIEPVAKCTGKYVAWMRMDLSHQATNSSRFLLTGEPGSLTAHTLDETLAGAGGLVISSFVPSDASAFEKMEYPKGSGVYPFSCTKWVVRQNPSGVVDLDPEFYDFTGGSTPELRMKWFDRDLDTYRVYERIFGGDEGFCRCDLPFVGVPPDCTFTCGPARYRRTADGCLDEECCSDCKEGMICDLQDTTLESMHIKSSFWRVDNTSTDIRFCLNSQEACKGGTVAGDLGTGYCKQNHHGPFCMLCVAGYYPSEGSCISCAEFQRRSDALIVAICFVLLVSLFYFAHRSSSVIRNSVAKLQTRTMLVKLKHVATFFQIVLLLPSVYIVPYPTSYVNFLKAFSFVNINVIQIFSLGCIEGWDFHVAFVFACAFPVGFYIAIGFAASLFSLIRGHVATQRAHTRQRAFALFLTFLWCYFPFICNRGRLQ
jgi:hypothetical protein